MALSDEEKAQLAALIEKDKAPDPDSDFEIEIYDGPKGARLPYSRGRKYLQDHFGIDLDPEPADDSGQGGEDKGKSDDKSAANGGKTGSKGTGGGKETEAQGYWSKRSARSA